MEWTLRVLDWSHSIHKSTKRIWTHYDIYLFMMISAMLIYGAIPNHSLAKVSGNCSNCHTMHDSQNGILEDPNSALTKTNCIGCHSHTGTETIIYLGGNPGDPEASKVPIVYNTQEPTYPLAGGNFYWMVHAGGDQAEKDARGHNVAGISPTDTALDAGAPGRPEITNDSGCYSCHKALTEEGCGCKSCHRDVLGKHHAEDHPDGNYNNIVDRTGGWYRFLYDHNYDKGAKGIESPDWEQLPASDLNQYQGVENILANPAGVNDHSMTDYCAGCHSVYHGKQDMAGSGTGTGDTNTTPWFRHPAHVGLPSGGEFELYTTYSKLAPVARKDLFGYTDPVSRTTVNADGYEGNDQVMCLSCHYAHASPYPDILRWDYQQVEAGDGDLFEGCQICHTGKN